MLFRIYKQFYDGNPLLFWTVWNSVLWSHLPCLWLKFDWGTHWQSWSSWVFERTWHRPQHAPESTLTQSYHGPLSCLPMGNLIVDCWDLVFQTLTLRSWHPLRVLLCSCRPSWCQKWPCMQPSKRSWLMVYTYHPSLLQEYRATLDRQLDNAPAAHHEGHESCLVPEELAQALQGYRWAPQQRQRCSRPS